jgi:MFS transporter, FSR family, fosmidomycin resistance protein
MRAMEQQVETAPQPTASPMRVLTVTGGIHAVHDGYTDTLYLLLPLWQAEFGLSYGAVGILRALYSAVLAGLQVPAASLASRFCPIALLAGGTAISGIGYVLAGASAGLPLLVASLVLGGIGSSVQHPIGSDLVAAAFPGNAARPALGTYNFAGDIGKMAFPAAASLLLLVLPWRATAICVGAFGIAAAAAVLLVLSCRQARQAAPGVRAPLREGQQTRFRRAANGFRILLSIGMADSATRMGFMTFLPFILAAKGASLSITGLALTLTFAGGACGKLAFGFLGSRLGTERTIILTKLATALLILAVLALPVTAILILLPLIGTMLNGTSSVIYGSVPDFVAEEERAHAFGIFYTATIGAGALSPVAFGFISDAIGLYGMMGCLTCTALVTLPLAHVLARTQSATGLPRPAE